ncbi:MAG: hypothetical protein JJLCMIEE_03531 [Acidimicrobiales bacterium]|nr:hypothetical protein [Acidimicrobiales bacterium]RIK03226.1 MAG: hypothetical protein DCC48_17080 [Acidobacteriota bacterium]
MSDPSVLVRQPAVAGMFYDDDPAELHRFVTEALSEWEPSPPPPKAVIVPHAGYRYSGATAASAFAALSLRGSRITRVVVLGPSHRVPLQGMAVSCADRFATPLGDIPVDDGARAAVLACPWVSADEVPHTREHSLEVQFPFIQVALGDVRILPIAVGRASPDQVADALERVWGGDETAVVVSSDMSHYHSYEKANSLDDDTTAKLIGLDVEEIVPDRMCGAKAVAGLLAVARRKAMTVRTLARCNSGDTPWGEKDRVVGYGAWGLYDADSAPLDADEESQAFGLAWSSIAAGLNGAKRPAPPEAPSVFARRQSCFVTLHVGGALRGCIGNIEALTSLGEGLIRYGHSAAFGDPRFPPLNSAEYHRLSMDLSLLSPLERVFPTTEEELVEMLRPGIDGLVLSSGSRRGTFLPSVWDQLADPAEFVNGVKGKAGLARRAWPDDIQVHLYQTTSMGPRPAPPEEV